MIYSTDYLLSGRQLCSSWSVLAYVQCTASRRSARPPRLARHAVLVHAVLPGAAKRWSILAKGFQNVAAPLHMFEALGGYDIEERLILPKTENNEETRDDFNGDPRGLRHTFWTASTIMFLEYRESMSFGKQQGRRTRLRITR